MHIMIFICRWKLVIHGGIDGHSRLIVYLNCCNNNLADSVLELFLQAVQIYGCPLRVRADRGCENTKVADYMISHGICRNPFICGRSVHNQRIERLWRDVFTGCTSLYYQLFYYMEDIGILHPDNSVDMFCLHFVYIPRINASLNQFTLTWNHHPLGSACNKSPLQIWRTGRHPELFVPNVRHLVLIIDCIL